MSAEAKPVPTITALNAPFWEGCRNQQLVLPRCKSCEGFHYPPAQFCPHCLGETFTWTQVSGRGRIISWVIYHHVYHPGFSEDVPYNVAIIELDEGPRMISNIVGCEVSELGVGKPVEVQFDAMTPEVTLPRFRLARR